MMNLKKQYIYVITAVLCWGTSATISKLILQKVDEMIIVALSFAVAAILLFVFMVIDGTIKRISEVSLGDFIRMIMIGSLGVFLYNIFYLKGIDLLQAQQAFVINYLWPAFIIIFSAVILGETLNIGKMVAIISSFLGVIVVTTNGSFEHFFSMINFKGVIYCILAATCYALYSTLSKKESYDKEMAAFVAHASGAIIAFVYILIRRQPVELSYTVAGGLLVYGVICNAVPYLLWTLALDNGDTAIIANLAYLTPFVSLLMTHFVLGEKITFFSVIGLVLIVGGILIQLLVQKKSKYVMDSK